MQFLMHNHAKTGMYWQWNVGLLRVLFLLSIKLSQTGSISNRRVQSILFTGPDNTSDGTKREKRLATCLPYSGGICSKYLDSEKLVYYTESPNVVEKRLSGPFTVIEGRFKDHCKTYALPALCLTSFPYCVSKTDPQPVKLCIDDCNHLYDVVCKHDFNLARRVATRYPPLFKIMPHCENLTKGSNCIELGFDEGLYNGPISLTKNTLPSITTAYHPNFYVTVKKDNNKSHEVVTSHPNRIYSDLKSSLHEQSSTSPNVSIFPEVKAGINNSTSNVLLKSESPTVVNAKNTSDKVEFQLKEGTTLMQTKSTLNNKPTKVSIIHLQVSIVGDTLITFPKDTASLYASAWPKENKDHPYSYQWQQISSPEGSHGYMEGKNAQRVVLSQLNKPGIYQLRVVVRSAHYAYGKTFVNITVEQPKRVNKPPRADISPKEQTITLPTNEVVLDGSKSSDDDRIVEYKWQELKGPLTEKNGKIIKSGVDSPVLQLKSLLPGVYTYKLTVTDSDGDTDSTTATVTVNEEKDYPPVARAGNDVVITLPENSVTLYGNGSTDDHGIKSYEWSKSPLSPACDLQGSSGPILHVSNMVGGDYSFTLRVTDSGGQTSDSRVTVVVRPEQNSPPVAKGGDDKDLVFPDDSTTLNAKDSSDDQGIASYKWEKLSGPSSVIMSGVDKMILNLSQLKEGHYVFKLTVTDTKGLTDTDTVSVTVKRDDNKPPTAVAGPDIVVKLPNRAAALDGSSSSDDYGIISYIWSRDLKSPAAGDVINGSDHQAILRLSNLVKGIYQFRLTVRDGKGKESHDDAKIYVKEDENGPNLVELYLDVDVTSFTEENKRQLVRKLAVSLKVDDSDIVIEHIQPSGRGNSLVVLFYVKDSLIKRPRDGKEISYLLKQQLRDNYFEFRMKEVEPYVCRNNCSGRGFCDQHTKQCICESFWMQDPFKARFGVKESNCDWSILYVTVTVFAVIVVIVGVTWTVCFCIGRSKRHRKKQQYSIIGDEDGDDINNETIELYDKFINSSIVSDTDIDSEEETLFENHRPYKPNRASQINGTIKNVRKNRHT